MPSGISFSLPPVNLNNPAASPNDPQTLTWDSNKPIVTITNASPSIDVTQVNYSSKEITIKSKPTGIVPASGVLPATLSLNLKANDGEEGTASINGEIKQQQKWGILDKVDSAGSGLAAEITAAIASRAGITLGDSSSPQFSSSQTATANITASQKWADWGITAALKAAATGAINATSELASSNASYGYNYNLSLTKTYDTGELILRNLQLSGGVSGNFASGDTRSLISPYLEVESVLIDATVFDVNIQVGGTVRSAWNGNEVDITPALKFRLRCPRP
jgi:hypothetical protein